MKQDWYESKCWSCIVGTGGFIILFSLNFFFTISKIQFKKKSVIKLDRVTRYRESVTHTEGLNLNFWDPRREALPCKELASHWPWCGTTSYVSESATVQQRDSHCFPSTTLMPPKKPNSSMSPHTSFPPPDPHPGLTGTFLIWLSNRCSIWAMSRFWGNRKNWTTSRREFSSSRSRVGRVNHSLEVRAGVGDQLSPLFSLLSWSQLMKMCVWQSLGIVAICICTTNTVSTWVYLHVSTAKSLDVSTPVSVYHGFNWYDHVSFCVDMWWSLSIF